MPRFLPPFQITLKMSFSLRSDSRWNQNQVSAAMHRDGGGRIETGVYEVEYSPLPRGGKEIKGFRDGEKNQKLEKRKTESF